MSVTLPANARRWPSAAAVTASLFLVALSFNGCIFGQRRETDEIRLLQVLQAPVDQQAPPNAPQPVDQQAPPNATAPVDQQAPPNATAPVYQQAPPNATAPVYQQAPPPTYPSAVYPELQQPSPLPATNYPPPQEPVYPQETPAPYYPQETPAPYYPQEEQFEGGEGDDGIDDR